MHHHRNKQKRGKYRYQSDSNRFAGKIELSETSYELNSHVYWTLKATITPDDVTEGHGTVTWESSNEAVATVDATGKVYGVSEGTCSITAKTENGLTASCSLKVTEPIEIALMYGTWEHGENFTFTFYRGLTGKAVIGTKVLEFTWEYTEKSEEYEEVLIYTLYFKDGKKGIAVDSFQWFYMLVGDNAMYKFTRR